MIASSTCRAASSKSRYIPKQLSPGKMKYDPIIPNGVPVFALFCLLLSVSCKSNDQRLTLRIRFDCYPTIIFDSLSNVLLSNHYSDLGGNSKKEVYDFISAERVYVKNLARGNDTCFYLNNVEPRYYEYLFIEGFRDGELFTGVKKELDFSETPGDTAEVSVCFEPNLQRIPN